MPIPVAVVVLVIVSGYTKLNAVILGRPVQVSPLLLVAAVVILALVVAALWILRTLIREGLRSSPYLRTVT
jgi:hypothetical protein